MNTKELIERAIEIRAALDAQKPLYEELEQITMALVGTVEMPVGDRVVTVVDNFADRNTVFRTAAVRRFELQIQTAEEFAYSRMTKAEKAAYTRAKNKIEKEGE